MANHNKRKISEAELQNETEENVATKESNEKKSKSEKSIHALISCTSGIIKAVSFKKDDIEVENYNMGNPSTKNKIASMYTDSADKTVTLGYANQFVRVFSLASKEFTHSQSYHQNPQDTLVSIVKHKGKFVTGMKSGYFNIWGDTGRPKTISTLPANISRNWREEHPNMEFLEKYESDGDIIATGGRENDLALWNLARPEKPIFKAKNVKPDMLDLRVPVWIADATFLHNSTTVATCTRHKQVRLYDTRAQPRPVVDVELGDSPLSKIISNPYNENEVFVGFSNGRISKMDLRRKNPKYELTVYKGFLGGVKDIVVHPNEPIIFSVSLDRYFRAFDLESGAMIYEHYTNSMPNGLVLTSMINSCEHKLFETQRDRLVVSYRKPNKGKKNV